VTAAGEHPEVVLEACYGWYWATDLLEELGCKVHLAHPLGNYPDVAVMPNFG
jgi:transposase